MTDMPLASNQKVIIDCNTYPFLPAGWEILEHHRGGNLEWSLDNIILLPSTQRNNDTIKTRAIRRNMHGKLVLNACVLDYLLKYPLLIPKDWKEKIILFWGTIYLSPTDNIVVLSLWWNGVRWCRRVHPQHSVLDSSCVSIIKKK